MLTGLWTDLAGLLFSYERAVWFFPLASLMDDGNAEHGIGLRPMLHAQSSTHTTGPPLPLPICSRGSPRFWRSMGTYRGEDSQVWLCNWQSAVPTEQWQWDNISRCLEIHYFCYYLDYGIFTVRPFYDLSVDCFNLIVHVFKNPLSLMDFVKRMVMLELHP